MYHIVTYIRTIVYLVNEWNSFFNIFLKCSPNIYFFIHKKHNSITFFWHQHQFLIFCFVITNTWFHLFARSQIEFWSSASLLRILFIFFHLLPDLISIFCFVITNTCFHSFTRSQIKFWSSTSLLRTLDFIRSPTLRLNFDLLLHYYEHLILFIHPLLDWISIFCFVITNTWFHSFTRSYIEFRSSASLLRTLDFILITSSQ